MTASQPNEPARATTPDRVRRIAVETLGVRAEDVTERASLIDDLGADSLDMVELVISFEEEFGIEVPDDAAETVLTIGDAVQLVDRFAAREAAIAAGLDG